MLLRETVVGEDYVTSKVATCQRQIRSTEWDDLSADSDRPEVQEMIRLAIQQRRIRVVPVPGRDDRVQIIPIRSPLNSA